MSYRLRPVVKYQGVRAKGRTYRNLASFNSECTKRSMRGNLCELTNLRCLKDGGGLATVKTRPGPYKSKSGGTWRLHFATCSILKSHLKGRVTEAGASLSGARRRKKRR